MTASKARKRYNAVRRRRPALFANPPDAAHEILTTPSMISQAEHAEALRLRHRQLPESWSLSGVVYEDQYQILLRDAVRRPDGSLGTYTRTTPASGAVGVAVLPILDDKAVLLHHFRHATRSVHLEIPRGFGESGVPARIQAERELNEETAGIVTELVTLGSIHPNTGASADPVELFLARIQQTGQPQTAEGISGLEFIEIPDLARKIADGQITDAFTITAWARATLRGLLPS